MKKSVYHLLIVLSCSAAISLSTQAQSYIPGWKGNRVKSRLELISKHTPLILGEVKAMFHYY